MVTEEAGVELFVGVLGPPIATLGGEPRDIGGPRQRRLLVALALRPGETVSVDALGEIVWPDADQPDDPRKTLHSYVYRLRRALGANERVEAVNGGYRLVPDDVTIDWHEFERLVGSAHRDDEPAEAVIDLVDEALALWRGTPLEEFADEDWARPDATRFEELWATAVERRCEALIEIDRAGEALAQLSSLVERHPLRERPRALQMIGLYRNGRQAEALRAYQDYRRFIVDEAGVDPSPELVELDRAIATQDASIARTTSSRQVKSYEIHESIGVGAFAEVYRGTQPALGRKVAIKAIRAELANRPEFIRAFEAEAAMVAGLEHPHIVPLYDFWREPDRAYLVMRWLTGGSLEGRLDRGRLDLGEATLLIAQVGAALRVAHRAGVIHRDVKPANILLDDEGNAYLGDFGIAQGEAEREGRQAALSEGSPAYASPEQLRRQPVGPATDVHGLAITLYEALAGHLPFPEARTRSAMLHHQLNDPVPPLSAARPDLPVELDPVLAQATAKDPASRYQDVEEFVSAFTAAVEGTAAGQSRALESAKRVTAVTGEVANPYKGLRAFDEGDADEFCGRRRLVDELVAAMTAANSTQRMLAVVGPSGSGKSSVVRAGLIPALRGGAIPGSDNWFVTSMNPGAQPYEALEAALMRVAVDPPASLVGRLMDGPRGIQRGVQRILADDRSQVLVVVDQFEELFTLCHDEEIRSRFLEALTVAVTDPSSPLRLVVTLRADFYDQPLRYPGFAELIKQRSVTVTPLATDELEEAIVDPAERLGVEFEAGLVSEIAADAVSQPGALPLMQYALTELFERRIAGVMTVEAYRDLGGLVGALARQAEELYERSSDVEQDAMRRLFGRLVTLGEGVEDTRRRVLRSELGSDSATARSTEVFGAARLLTFDRDVTTREPTIEVAHEALLREWPRLRDWLDDDRGNLRIHRMVTIEAMAWEAAGRDAGNLLRGGRFEAAAELVAERHSDLNEAERAFVRASSAARDEERRLAERTTRRLRRLVASVSIVALVALIAGVLAIAQWRDANRQRAIAEDVADVAEQLRDQAIADADQLALALAGEELARQKAETAVQESRLIQLRQQSALVEDPVVGTLLAVEAANLDPGPASLNAVAAALTDDSGWLASLPGVFVLEAPGQPWFISIEDPGVVLRDVHDYSVVQSIPFDFGFEGQGPAVSPDGTTLVVGEPGGLRLFDLMTGLVGDLVPVPNILPGGPGSGRPAFTSDGRHLVAAVDEGLAVLSVDGSTLTEEFRHVFEGGPSTSGLDYDPTRDRLALVLDSSVVILDTSALDAGQFTEVSRIEMGLPPSDGQGMVDYGIDGSLYTAWGDDFWRVTDEDRVRLQSGDAVGTPVRAQPLADGTVLLAGFSDSVIIDPESGLVVDDLDLVGFALEAVDLGDGDAIAVANSGLGGVALRVDIFSRVRGTPLMSVLPDLPFDGDLKYRDGYLSRFDLGRMWRLDGDRWTPMDFGVSDVARVAFKDSTAGLVALVGTRDGRWTIHRLPGGEQVGVEIVPEVDGWAVPTHDLKAVLVWSVDAVYPYELATGAPLEPIVHDGGVTDVAIDRVRSVGIGFANGRNSRSVFFDSDALVALGPSVETCPVQDIRNDLDYVLVACETGLELRAWPDLRMVRAYPGTETRSFGGSFSDDQGYLVANGTNGIQFWDVESGEAMSPFIDGQADVRFGAPPTIIRDGRMHVFNDDASTWVDVACRAAGRNLSRVEWTELMPPEVEYSPTCEQFPVEPPSA